MDIGIIPIIMAIAAGIASVASPCVLPVIPIVVTGTENEHYLRPFFVVLGLSVTFILMGIITSLFGSFLVGKMHYIEKIAGALISLFGVLMIFDINIFKKLTIFSHFRNVSKGRLSGLFLGMTLGVIWIPCIGPLLSSVLATVAAEGQVIKGVILLTFYSLGFLIPMLIAAYSARFFRNKVSILMKRPFVVRWISGGILIVFGLYIVFKGGIGL